MYGRNRKPGKLRDTALLNSMINKNRSWAMKRLMKDLKEIEENTIPTVGVTARPTDKDIFTWRGNLRGPEDTPYKGGVFHIEIKFPELYPTEPPKIKLMTPLTHPNVFGSEICLDMLNSNDKVLYQGWTSGYTVQSVLIQLQSFLFEKPPKDSEERIKEEVKAANEFKDLSINHKGPLSPYPPFNIKEKDEENFLLDMTDEELLEEEVVCFHTRLRLSKKETVLGAGIAISRLPRTGEIRSVSTTLDLLSIQAYMKCGVRTSLSNEKFTHFLPLFFGVEKEKTIFLAEHSLGFICKGSTKKFEPTQVLEVLPKMLLTLAVDMTNEALHHSYKSIRMFIYTHRLLTLFLEKYPELKKTIDSSIAKFIEKPESRIKEETPNIGELLVLLTVSEKFKWADLKDSYLNEQLDRQVFWILQEIPDLDKVDDPDLEDAKIEASFKSTIVGYRITMLLKLFNTEIFEEDPEKLPEILDHTYCRLNGEKEDGFKKLVDSIFEVRNFLRYYEIVEKEVPDKKTLAADLKKAVENSLAKKYHGDETELNVIPEMQDQVKELHHGRPTLLKYWDEKLQKLDREGDEDFWQRLCRERFGWIAERAAHSFEKWTPKDFAEKSDALRIHGSQKGDDTLIQWNNKQFGTPHFEEVSKQKTFHEYGEDLTWCELFAKLDFEEFLDTFPMLNDFRPLYDYLHAVNGRVKSLFLRIQYKRKLKSGYYWYMVILSNLTNLESLIISDVENRLGSTYKYLIKGFNNFYEKGGKLKKLFLHQAYTSYLSGGIYKLLKNLPDLESIQTYGSNLCNETGVALGKILSDNKNVKELDLTGTSYNDKVAKDIADGLMRAKMLEILKLRDSSYCVNGITSMLYNLAFSPRIKLIDLTNISIGGNTNLCEALYKLVKISGSLEHLILNNTSCAQGLTQDFFLALGENKTLQSLQMDSYNQYTNEFAKKLGKAVAMNSKKKGSLDTLSCKGAFSQGTVETFINNLYISEQDHEYWYGDASTANKMEGNDLEKNLFCNIIHFNIESCQINFTQSIAEIKKRNKPYWPALVKLFSTDLTNMRMTSCNLWSKKNMELISCCVENPIGKTKCTSLNLSKNRINKEGAKIFCEVLKKQFTIKNLDLSGNKLGVAGCQAIAKALLNNTSIKYLNLYSNQMDVDGARCLKETLLVNDTLEYIDVGSNRLRDKGILAMAEGISGNKTCALKGISTRFNFISDDGAERFFDITLANSKIDKVFIKNNHLTEPYITTLEKRIKASEQKVYVDCLDKMQFLDQDRLDRSIWISPINTNFTVNNITQFFQETHECGLVKSVRVCHARQIPGKPGMNSYAFVEFEHENSVARSLRVASKKKSILMGSKFRIYKAGTAANSTTTPQAAKIPHQRNCGRGGRGRGGRRRGRR